MARVGPAAARATEQLSDPVAAVTGTQPHHGPREIGFGVAFFNVTRQPWKWRRQRRGRFAACSLPLGSVALLPALGTMAQTRRRNGSGSVALAYGGRPTRSWALAGTSGVRHPRDRPSPCQPGWGCPHRADCFRGSPLAYAGRGLASAHSQSVRHPNAFETVRQGRLPSRCQKRSSGRRPWCDAEGPSAAREPVRACDDAPIPRASAAPHDNTQAGGVADDQAKARDAGRPRARAEAVYKRQLLTMTARPEAWRPQRPETGGLPTSSRGRARTCRRDGPIHTPTSVSDSRWHAGRQLGPPTAGIDDLASHTCIPLLPRVPPRAWHACCTVVGCRPTLTWCRGTRVSQRPSRAPGAKSLPGLTCAARS